MGALASKKYKHCVRNRVVFMRGCPGSGKSILAAEIAGKYPPRRVQIISTDNYWFLNDSGTYKFEPSLLGTAHSWNQRQFASLCKKLRSGRLWCIIVDNTNITAAEMQPYVKIAHETYNKNEATINIEAFEPQNYRWTEKDALACFVANTNVKKTCPIGVIKDMIRRFEENVSFGNNDTVTAVTDQK